MGLCTAPAIARHLLFAVLKEIEEDFESTSIFLSRKKRNRADHEENKTFIEKIDLQVNEKKANLNRKLKLKYCAHWHYLEKNKVTLDEEE